MTDDWQDPFAEDEAARERERRRAEREARRQANRRALADKVRDERAEAASDGSPPTAERAVPSRATPARSAARPTVPPPRRPGADALRRRRIVGLVLVVAALGIVAFVAAKVADRIGGDDSTPVETAAGRTFEITIPEGLDRRQIADVAKEAGVKGDYEAASKRASGFDPGRYGAENPDSLEGFLFPATYELRRNSKAEALVSRQLDAFRDRIRGIDMGYAESKNLTEYDVVIIASMIEREVQVPEERPLVAAVIYNRLAAGMNLAIDATIRYEDGNYDEQLTRSRLDEDTPYNTRLNPGLPPGPIGNPGEASLKAAAKPAKENYLYYVIKPGTCNEHFFTASEDEFRAAADEYQAALEEEGGAPGC